MCGAYTAQVVTAEMQMPWEGTHLLKGRFKTLRVHGMAGYIRPETGLEVVETRAPVCYTSCCSAEVVEMADTRCSGRRRHTPVRVQIPSSAPFLFPVPTLDHTRLRNSVYPFLHRENSKRAGTRKLLSGLEPLGELATSVQESGRADGDAVRGNAWANPPQ